MIKLFKIIFLTSLLSVSSYAETGEFLLNKDENGQYSFHPIFQKNVYNFSMELIAYNYNLSSLNLMSSGEQKSDSYLHRFNEFLFENFRKIKIKLVKNKIESFKQKVNSSWVDLHVFSGSSGVWNKKIDEAMAVGVTSQDRSLMLVGFRGTQQASDWASDFSFFPNLFPSDVSYFFGNLLVHYGFSNNHKSVENELNDYIFDELEKGFDQKNGWIIFTGHSKGAAQALLAALSAQQSLKKRGVDSVKVGVLAVSSPRVVFGDESKVWVERLLGKNNILRIEVQEDLVPQCPLDQKMHYRSVGREAVESLSDLKTRKSIMREGLKAYLEDSEINTLMRYTSWIPGQILDYCLAHYVDPGVEFMADMVMSYERVLELIL